MAEPLARIYDLALRALDEQRDDVSQLRSRIAPILAVAGVGLTLLARPVFAEGHPSGAVEVLATIIGLLGAVVLVLGSAYVLRPRAIGFAVDARATLSSIRAGDAEVLEDADRYYETMVRALARRARENQPMIDRLRVACGVALLGLLLELGGLATAAALAS